MACSRCRRKDPFLPHPLIQVPLAGPHWNSSWPTHLQHDLPLSHANFFVALFSHALIREISAQVQVQVAVRAHSLVRGISSELHLQHETSMRLCDRRHFLRDPWAVVSAYFDCVTTQA